MGKRRGGKRRGEECERGDIEGLQGRLDQQGWDEAIKAHWVLIHAMEDIFKGARLRLLEAGEPEGGTFSAYGQFFFEAPPPEAEESGDKEE